MPVMPSLETSLPSGPACPGALKAGRRLVVAACIGMVGAGAMSVLAPEAPAFTAPPSRMLPQTAPQSPGDPPKPVVQPPVPPAPTTPDPESSYDPSIFQKPIPHDQMTFLNQFAGAPAKDLLRDKEFHRLVKLAIPDCLFHYGTDKLLDTSMDEALSGSTEPVHVRDGRYVLVSGAKGPYLGGRGFLWFDMQEGIALGGFYFHPTNGEPTPTVTIFSRQVREKTIAMSQLPAAFAEDLSEWAEGARVPPITTRYFIGDLHKRLLLEHDEDYCAPGVGWAAPPPGVCQQMNADAADIDLNTAYYLEQIHYATNGTAWMIVGPQQTAFLAVRTSRCGGVLDPLGCRITVTRDHIHTVIGRPPSAPHPAPGPHPR